MESYYLAPELMAISARMAHDAGDLGAEMRSLHRIALAWLIELPSLAEYRIGAPNARSVQRPELETCPFPPGLTLDVPAADYADDPRAAAIAEASRRLVELRDRWLNPPEWVEWVDEPVPGYSKRPVSRDEDAAKALKKRTLTNLYNARPQWLADAHEALDAAVAAAYGWSADISDDEVLRELLALNGGGTANGRLVGFLA